MIFNQNYAFLMVRYQKQLKLVGVIVSQDLKWQKNTDYICTKASQKLWIIKRLKKFKLNIFQLLDVCDKSMQFYIKTKDVLFRSMNKVPRNTLASICFKTLRFQNGVSSWPNLEILKKGKMNHFQGNCSSRKNHAGMKQINFSGTLVRVHCKTPPNIIFKDKNCSDIFQVLENIHS